MQSLVALAQGLYFVIFGIWPILHMNSFLKVTGSKTDLWLVKTVGIILAVIGSVLIFADINAQINSSMVLLAIGSALSLAIVEFIYVAKRVISPIYLADAVVELVFIAWWGLDRVLS